MAEKRIAIPKTLRFEVFKRDSFTCQYCGKMAPDVILEIDHINPVKQGGKNDILNLITSCKDCNRGKGARPLDENQELKKQQDQLKELNEKREQMKAMLRWREELKAFDNEKIDVIDNYISGVSKFSASKHGRAKIKKWIETFGVETVLSAAETAFATMSKNDDEAAWGKAFNKIGGICYNISNQGDDPLGEKKAYIYGIMRNRFPMYDNKRVWSMLNGIITDEENTGIVTRIAKHARNWSCFWSDLNDEYGGGW